ncbi:MAG: hypothetical protein EAZ41_08510 [Sphingobacteriia bacterium]|nr:MAG: hypothetical protein EAZ41_08510 [Sphingobacteriia bacterium]
MLILTNFMVTHGNCQQFHALHGSSFAGASSIFNNPASPNNSLHRWDLNIFSFQFANSTNTLYAKNMKFPAIGNATINLTQGAQERNINTNLNLNFLNAMYRINKKQAVAVGLRMRMNNHIQSNAFNLNDSIGRLNAFLSANRNIPQIEGKFTNAGWIEANLNYAQVLFETGNSRLSGGITFQMMKSLSGAFAHINRLTYLESIRPTDSIYSLTGGVGSFAYSANMDTWSSNFNTQGNISNFIKASKTAIGFSAGLEYILYQQNDSYNETEPKIYNWKLGLSLMDIGSNQYNTSKFTGKFFYNNRIANDRDISNKLSNIKNAKELRDSLSSLLDTIITLPRTFSIGNPARIILNADRYLGNNFFINGQLTIPLSNSYSSTGHSTNELSLISLTPRWETRNWGIFLPIQYNLYGLFWAGFAIKAGPLLAGFHHLGLLKKDPLLNGGGYIMLSIHPFSKKQMKSRLDCFE